MHLIDKYLIIFYEDNTYTIVPIEKCLSENERVELIELLERKTNLKLVETAPENLLIRR